MDKAFFAKYNRTNLCDAIEKIKKLKTSNATPINYYILVEYICSYDEAERMFAKGTIIGIEDIASYGIYSISSNGIWNCIKLITDNIEILMYTAGTSEILYYSIIV